MLEGLIEDVIAPTTLNTVYRIEVKEPIMSSQTPSLAEICSAVKQPTGLPELFANIKHALDHHLLIRRDFYTREYLEIFFGGNAEIADYSSAKKEIDIIAKVGKLTGILSNPNKYRNDDITIFLRPGEQDKTTLQAVMQVPSTAIAPGINVDFVRGLFGHGNEMIVSDSNALVSQEALSKRFADAPRDGPPPHMGYHCEATHPMGCKVIEFRYPSTVAAATRIALTTAAGSEIKTFNIMQHG